MSLIFREIGGGGKVSTRQRQDAAPRHHRYSVQSTSGAKVWTSNGGAATGPAFLNVASSRHLRPSRAKTSNVRASGSTYQQWAISNSAQIASLSVRPIYAVDGERTSQTQSGAVSK